VTGVLGVVSGVFLRTHPSVLDDAVERIRDRGVLTRAIAGTSLQVSPALNIESSDLSVIAAAVADALAERERTG
jgi:adenosylmethionine-8-amino-7-oxononanoate aminotransferase